MPTRFLPFDAVINQMDTSQAHLSSKATSRDTSKPNDLSKDELHAVLKYGAQKMCVSLLLDNLLFSSLTSYSCLFQSFFPVSIPFVTISFDKDDNQQNQKLDEMDLDDILNRAEDHETIANQGEGASLGGEGFLAQFANVSDIKNDMNWEDIIPLEDRQRFEQEETHRKLEELAQQEAKDRKRNHAPVSYEGMDVEHTPASSAPKKPKGPAPQRKTASQKAMELKERDVRVLIRSLQRWGDIRQRYDIIVSTSFVTQSSLNSGTHSSGRRGEVARQEQRHDHRHCRRHRRALRPRR